MIHHHQRPPVLSSFSYIHIFVSVLSLFRIMHRLHISPVWLISITIRLGYASLGDHPGASIGSSVAIATRTTSSPVEATISGVSPVSTLIEARYHAPARTWTTSQFTSGPSYQGRLSTRSSSIPTSSSDSSVYNMSTAIATPTSTTDDMTAISWPPGSWQSMVNIRPAAYNASSPDYRHQFVCPGTIKDTPPGGFPEPFHQTEKIQIWRIENFAFDLDPIGRIHSFAFRWSECATCRRYIQCDFHQPFSRGVFNRCQWPEFDFAFLNYPTSTLLIQSLPTFQ